LSGLQNLTAAWEGRCSLIPSMRLINYFLHGASMGLQGKVALVTGAGRGIGPGIARVLAEKGMILAVNARSASAEQTADDLRRAGYQATAFVADISRKTDVEAMVERIENELGPLWLLVNNAGLLRAGPTADLTEEDWDEIFAVDAKGVFLCAQAAIKRMMPRRAGRIVNLSSIAGMIVRTKQIAYSSAKAAVIHFSRCLAVEMASYGITVNCLCPGMTRTEMLMSSAAERGIDLEAAVNLIPTGRMAEPEDHAHLVAYFASAEAAHVTGQVVCVDGGQSQFMPIPTRRL
jgi:NAD(P)-dependent dehydrogenase (short-subunit alcohol dehydrogenase family)